LPALFATVKLDPDSVCHAPLPSCTASHGTVPTRVTLTVVPALPDAVGVLHAANASSVTPATMSPNQRNRLMVSPILARGPRRTAFDCSKTAPPYHRAS